MDSHTTANRLRRLARDLAVVVAGILIAFGLDALWSAHLSREAANESLLAVRAEFISNGELLDESIAMHTSGKDAASELLGYMSPDAEAIPFEQLSGLIPRFMQMHTYNPRRGAVETLVNSPSFGTIENDSLQTILAGWVDQLTDATEEEMWLISDASSRLQPLLGKYLPMRTGLAYAGIVDSPSRFEHDVVGLLRNRDIEHELSHYTVLDYIIIEEQTELRAEIDRVIDLIDEEL